MTDRLDLAFQHAVDLGLDVEWDHLGDHRRGHYLDEPRRIVLNHLLTSRQLASTLAHEVGHAVFRDRCTFPAGERRAWEYGASLLVTPEEYAAAEAVVGHHPCALALELEVTPDLIVAWRRWFVRCFPREYRRLLATSVAVGEEPPSP